MSKKYYGCGQGGVKTPSLTINPLFEDGFTANRPEYYYAIAALSGTAQNVESGNQVQATLNGKTYLGVVDSNGEWSIPLPPSEIRRMSSYDPEDTHDLVVSVTNNHGQSTEQVREVYVYDMFFGREAGIGINPIAGNDEIIGREKLNGQVISGMADYVAESALVTVTLEGKSWQVPVDANGVWSLTLTAEEVKALAPGTHTINVQVPGEYDGTITSVERTFTVTKDKGTSYAAEISVNSIAGDDLLTAVEQQSSLMVSGTTENVASGKQVWVQLGDNIYAATVKNNHWQIKIPADALGQLHDGSATLIAWVKDLHETATTVREFTVGESLTAPWITLDTAYNGYSVSDLQWSMITEVLSGEVTNVAAGSYLNVAFGNLHYQARVDENGQWRLPIAPHDLLSQPVGAIPLVLSITNERGETTALSKTIEYYGLDTAGETQIAINPISGDDVLNAREKQTALLITGDTLNVPDGQTVEVRFPDALPGYAFFGNVDQNGEWRISLSPSQLSALPAGLLRIEVTIEGNDQWSNPNGGPLTSEHWLRVEPGDSTENMASLTIDSLEDYGRLTLDQLDGLTVSGSASNVADGSEVWLQVGDWAWTGEVHQGQWQVTIPADKVPALETGGVIFEASVRNNANGDSAGDAITIILDPAAPPDGPFVRLDPVWGNDHITRTESFAPDYLVTGSFTGNNSSNITVTLNGKNYDAQVANGSWMVWLPDQDVLALPDGETALTVQWGELSDSTTLTLNSDADAPLYGVTLDAVTGNNLVAVYEMFNGLPLSGGVLDASVAPIGTPVTVTFNGETYQTALTGAADNPRWSLTIPASVTDALPTWHDEIITVTLGVAGGQSVPVARLVEFVDEEYSSAYMPQIIINPVGAGDDVFNLSDDAATMLISGYTRYFESGKRIVISMNGNSWETTNDDGGRWQIEVPADSLEAWISGAYNIHAVAYGVNADNQPDIVAEVDRSVTILTEHYRDPTIAIDPVTADNVLLLSEAEQGLTVSGTVTDVADNAQVALQIGDKSYSATVQQGRWQLTIAPEDLPALQPGDLALTASVAGQSGASAQTHVAVPVLANDEVQITIDPLAQDNLVSRYYEAYDHTITGTLSHTQPGTAILLLNGKSYAVTVANGEWMAVVPGEDINALPAGQVPLTIEWHPRYDTTLPSATTLLKVDGDMGFYPRGVTLDAISGDDSVQLAELENGLTLSGGALNWRTAQPGTPVYVEINGKHYQTEMTGVEEDSDPRWSLTVPAADLAGLSTVIINVTGAEGQAWIATSRALTIVDDGAPTETPPAIVIDPVVGTQDSWGEGQPDVLEPIEKEYASEVSGHVVNIAEGSLIEYSLNGITWQDTLSGDALFTYIPDPVRANIADGVYQLGVAITDAVTGVKTYNERTIRVDFVADNDPVITLDAITGDNVLLPAEVNSALTLSGTLSHFEAQQTLYASLWSSGDDNDKFYSTTVNEDGSWRIDLPAGEWGGLQTGDLAYLLTLNSVDSLGNRANAEQLITLASSDDATPPDFDALGLSGGQQAIAALLDAPSSASAQLTSAAQSHVVLPAAADDLWTTAARSELDVSPALTPAMVNLADQLQHQPV